MTIIGYIVDLLSSGKRIEDGFDIIIIIGVQNHIILITGLQEYIGSRTGTLPAFCVMLVYSTGFVGLCFI